MRDQGIDVASAKSGPDYIDPQFHHLATGRPCLNLDPWAADPEQLRARAASISCDTLVIEGAMGLFDGAGVRGLGSTADLARALQLPVLLVLDSSRMSHGAGALIAGLRDWAPDLTFVGVILNKIGSARHGAMVKASVERVLPVLGAVPRNTELSAPSRHLGLVQPTENPNFEIFLSAAGRLVSDTCDLDTLCRAATSLPRAAAPRPIVPLGQRIAVAKDRAFSFFYPHMLDDWRSQGAEVTFFSPLNDDVPDSDADAIFLPGGYPELHAGRLAGAQRYQSALRAASESKTVYGECGGYMALGAGMVDAQGERHAMAGLLQLETSFEKPIRSLGYRRLSSMHGPVGGTFSAHEFHYATTVTAKGVPLFTASDADGVKLPDMGLVDGRTSGSFAHLIEAV